MTSLGKPRDAKRRSSGRIFLSNPHTHDSFLYVLFLPLQALLPFTCLLGISYAFFLNDDLASSCPAPCDCTRSLVLCKGKYLGEVPAFNLSRPITAIYLDSNSITEVPAFAFASVASSSNISVLHLDDNPIKAIDTDAFVGLGNSLTLLGLSNTSIDHLPIALMNLSKLTHLYLSDNSLSSLNEMVIDRLSTSLTYLDIKNNSFIQWPSSLRRMDFLSHLYLQNNTIRYIPVNAFHGFKNSLKVLSLSNTSLTAISEAFRSLTNLDTLILDSNPIGDSGFPGGIFDSMKQSLRSLSINNVSITHIPDAVKQLTELRSLDISNNNLRYISEDDVTQFSNLQEIILDRCGLTRIPSAILILRNLTRLILDNNYITTLERNDLDGLSSLKTLSMKNVTLLYISPEVFLKTPGISSIVFSNNKLCEIPVSLKYIHTQRVLVKLDSNSIECSCYLAWLLNHKTKFDFIGQCENHNMAIQSYFSSVLPVCRKP